MNDARLADYLAKPQLARGHNNLLRKVHGMESKDD
jgi:hypothetical protein